MSSLKLIFILKETGAELVRAGRWFLLLEECLVRHAVGYDYENRDEGTAYLPQDESDHERARHHTEPDSESKPGAYDRPEYHVSCP